MARAHFVKKARKPNAVVTAADIKRANNGEEGAASYWWWAFRYGGKHFSKTKPKASQLTQSEFYAAVYGLQEARDAFVATDKESLEGAVAEWVDRAREIAEECREKFDNMPEGLQQGDTGQLLEERAEAMDAYADELESIDLEDMDEDQDLGDWVGEKLEEIMAVEMDY